MDKIFEIVISYIGALYHSSDDVLTTIAILFMFAVSAAAYSVELAVAYYNLARELLRWS